MRRLTIILLAVAGLATACQGNVFDLDVGDCFQDPDGFGEVSDVEIVDCSEPHDNEVFHLFDLAEGDYPGQATVSTLADEGCSAAFDGYVGIAYAESRYVYTTLSPTEESWDRGDDREVVCFLFDINFEQLSGSARNSRQ